jgi:hypothetical protein
MPSTKGATLDRERVVRLLKALSRHAAERGAHIDLFLVGGGAMVLAYNVSRTTDDIEGIFEPKQLAYSLAAEVASEVDFPVREDWLNDAVKIFPFPKGQTDVAARAYYEDAGLTVRVASPRYLFLMKALSARESDEDDLRILWPLCRWQSAQEALDEIEASYPRVVLRPVTRYMVESIAEQARQAVVPTGQPCEPPGSAYTNTTQEGAVWVRAHMRKGSQVHGYWRRSPSSPG